jgi:formylglycine-generating enzyme required for sulfatase activity
VAELTVDGVDHFPMTHAGGHHGDLALYRCQVELGVGQHHHAFHFEDGGQYSADIPEIEGPFIGIFFSMGSPETELGRDPDETLHTVILVRNVLASDHEVTQAEWEATGLTNPSRFVGPDLPVESITWYEAIEYCNRLSATEGLNPAYTFVENEVDWDKAANGWRLPTEAEWEYLCRAGTQTAFANGDITTIGCLNDPVLDTSGWYCGNAGATTHPVNQKLENAFGLFDMHGNVWEWCWDWFQPEFEAGVAVDPTGPLTGSFRVIRGGSWESFTDDCRSASREFRAPQLARDDRVGLRVVRTIPSD